ncbi:MAG: type II and III secretion system protein [Ignavibacteriaceae bacterium]
MKTFILSVCLIFTFASVVLPQDYLEKQFKGYSPDELVTMSASLPFNQAIELLSKVSESTTGKRIVSTIESTNPIGIELTNMPYDKALMVLVQYAGYMYEEKEDVIIVKRKQEEIQKDADTYASIDAREVKISAVFFELDVNESKKRGIDWQFLLSREGLDISTGLLTETQTSTSTETQQTKEPGFDLGGSHSFDAGGFFGEATALFRFFETENLGEIIANPNITVRDGTLGKIQVGADFSIRQKDFAGNTVEKFYPTGTIIEVTPHVYNEDGIDYILLDITVERSSFQANELTSEIRKTNANTQVLMLNGEETVLGGLFVNEETKVRNGIPILKDLPWWVLGIRYLTGSDETVVIKKELVILIKAEIIPTLKERLANGFDNEHLLQKEIKKNQDRIKYYQLNESGSN